MIYPSLRFANFCGALKDAATAGEALRASRTILIDSLAWEEVKEFFRRTRREMMRGYEQG